MDETLAKELYQHYGGVARFVLQLPKANPSKGLDKLLEELHEAVASCDTDQVSGAQGCNGIRAWLACCPLALAHGWMGCGFRALSYPSFCQQPKQPLSFAVRMQTVANVSWLNQHGAGCKPHAATHCGR